jgi:hypothetical protein
MKIDGGIFVIKHWMQNGKYTCDNFNPSMISYHVDEKNVEKKVSEVWYDDFSEKHRDDLAAVITWENGKKVKEEWYQHGKKCRKDILPDEIHYSDSGKIIASSKQIYDMPLKRAHDMPQIEDQNFTLKKKNKLGSFE